MNQINSTPMIVPPSATKKRAAKRRGRDRVQFQSKSGVGDADANARSEKAHASTR